MSIRCRNTCFTLALAPLLAACASTTPDWDRQFGQSVRTVTARQTRSPMPVRQTQADGADGKSAVAAMARYHQSLAEPAPQQKQLGGGAEPRTTR